MVFSSVPFLFYFLPLFLAVYFISPGIWLKNVSLVAFSLVFYAWGEPFFVLVMMLSIAFNYGVALGFRASGRRARAASLVIGIAGNLALLAHFKYSHFFVTSWNLAVGEILRLDPGQPGALPIGISFFTFHAISYLVDAWRGEVKAERNPLLVAVYIAMFPQLVAGPIIRFKTISAQLSRRRTTFGRAAAGARIFLIGLAQKVLIADEVARIADVAFDPARAPALQEAWLGLLAYTLQIYFDFAGYSNMAIGMGIVLGFTFPRNFRLPYTSRSVTEFWRRWHISLSAWLRDYLYFPLGGSRGSRLATYRNLVVVFVLCGLWHGASWNFVVWGLHHGAFLVAERAGLGKLLGRAPPMVQWAYAMLAVMTGWVWFRASNLDQAGSFFAGLIGLHGFKGLSIPSHLAVYPASVTALLVGCVLAVMLRDRTHGVRAATPLTSRYPMAYALSFAVIAAITILKVANGAYSPFLYFRF